MFPKDGRGIPVIYFHVPRTKETSSKRKRVLVSFVKDWAALEFIKKTGVFLSLQMIRAMQGF